MENLPPLKQAKIFKGGDTLPLDLPQASETPTSMGPANCILDSKI